MSEKKLEKLRAILMVQTELSEKLIIEMMKEQKDHCYEGYFTFSLIHKRQDAYIFTILFDSEGPPLELQKFDRDDTSEFEHILIKTNVKTMRYDFVYNSIELLERVFEQILCYIQDHIIKDIFEFVDFNSSHYQLCTQFEHEFFKKCLNAPIAKRNAWMDITGIRICRFSYDEQHYAEQCLIYGLDYDFRLFKED